MSAELLKSYLKLVLEEKQASLDEEGAAASGGGNTAGAVAGYVLPLGASNSKSRRKSRKSRKSAK